MSASPEEPQEGIGVEATMLLCDAAQSVGGKLYILGGGWSQIPAGSAALQHGMALAIRLAVPWDQANEPLDLQTVLVTDQGAPVDLGHGPVAAGGNLEVGRPPGLRRGTPLDSTLALNFGGLALTPGGYVWELKVNGETKARAPFRVLSQGQD